MKELISITEKNGEFAVSARELHKFLEATERFSYWFERQKQYGFIDGIDYVGCKEFNALANQELEDFALTIDCAKEISMLQRNEKGKQARQYFIVVEKKFKNQIQTILPQTFSDALRMLAEQVDENDRQKKILEDQAPKVRFAEAVTGADTNILMRDLAKLICQSGINIGEGRLYNWMVDHKYLIRRGRWSNKKQKYDNDYTPAQKAADLKVFFMTENVVTVGESSFITHTIKITPKGQEYFINKFITEKALTV